MLSFRGALFGPFDRHAVSSSRSLRGGSFRPILRYMRIWRIVVVAAVLAACADPPTSPTPEPPYGGRRPVESTTTPSVIVPETQVRRDWAQAIRNYINETRQAGFTCVAGTYKGEYFEERYMPPTHPLRLDDRLRDAAEGHARDGAENPGIAHIGSDGSTVADRVRGAGYPYGAGENVITWQSRLSPEMLPGYAAERARSWEESPPHCHNMMRPYYRDIGVGAATTTTKGAAFVSNFGHGR